MEEILNEHSPQDSEEENNAELEETQKDTQLLEVIDAIDQLPPEQKRKIALRFESWYSGPLPPPNYLERYENISPGSAETIIKNMIDESNHRRRMEEKVFTDGTNYSTTGLKIAFLVALLGICAGLAVAIIAILFGGIAAQVSGIITGTVLSGASIVSLVRKFIDGPKSSINKNNEKEDDE